MATAGEQRDPSSLKERILFPFQVEGVAHAYEADEGLMFIWDAGLGKSVGATGLGTVLLDDRIFEQILLICEQNKLREWVRDLQEHTSLTVRAHHGPNRWKKLEKEGLPQILVTTYETAKADGVVKTGPRALRPGRLLATLKGKRTLVVYDEIAAKLRNRSSGNYRAHEHILETLRKAAPTKVLGLTATPISRSYEDGFNQLRLIAPGQVPQIKDWERECIRGRDRYDRPLYHMAGVEAFMGQHAHLIHRKRKTDPDVIDQFPALMEEFRYIEMSDAHREFYEVLEEIAFEDGGDFSNIGNWMTLRQALGHPASLLYSSYRDDGSPLAKEIVRILGPDHLRKIRCRKLEELMDYLDLIVNSQQDKAVVFTYFGASVLQVLADEMDKKRIRHFTFHGGRTPSANEAAKQHFRHERGGCVLLASDAAARGINLPEATYVIQYDGPLTYELYTQRLNRAHRIGKGGAPVTSMTYITENSLEEAIARVVLRRNEVHDLFAGDLVGEVSEEFVSAADRRSIMNAARKRFEERQAKRAKRAG